VFIQVDQGFSAAEVAGIAGKIPWTDYGYQVPTVELLECAPESASDEPDIVAVQGIFPAMPATSAAENP
jgi:hypothetical protein